jgi:hypothetical protein
VFRKGEIVHSYLIYTVSGKTVFWKLKDVLKKCCLRKICTKLHTLAANFSLIMVIKLKDTDNVCMAPDVITDCIKAV